MAGALAAAWTGERIGARIGVITQRLAAAKTCGSASALRTAVQSKFAHLGEGNNGDAKTTKTVSSAANAAWANLADYIDHTALKPAVSASQVATLCAEARQFRFPAVCVNPCRAAQAVKLLLGSPVRVAVVVGFPLGANTPSIKAAETRELCAMGVTEIDMVMNVGALLEEDYALVFRDVRAVVRACSSSNDAHVKVIFQNCLLTDKTRIVDACILSVLAGAHYVKTSTGFGSSGAKLADVALMRKVVGPLIGVKGLYSARVLFLFVCLFCLPYYYY
jgi:deoxyribose-phosphate aldolase